MRNEKKILLFKVEENYKEQLKKIMKVKRGKGSGKLATKKEPITKEPSTPILFNQNSNSCSNDTNISAASNSTLVNQQTQQQNQILQKEGKIRNLLKELQTFVKKCHQERLNNEPNLTNIIKTHERLKKEDKSILILK